MVQGSCLFKITCDEERWSTKVYETLTNVKLVFLYSKQCIRWRHALRKLSLITSPKIPLSYHHNIAGTAVTSTIKWGQQV